MTVILPQQMRDADMPAEIQSRVCTQIKIVPIGDEHLEAAAVLFVARYQQARQLEPLLPACHEHAERIVLRLRHLARRGIGVAAMQGSRTVGFMLARVVPSFHGGRAAYAPEWAHAVAAANPREIYQAMYARASGQWVADGCHKHVVSLLAHDRQIADTFWWLGFGLTCIDAMRELCVVPDEASCVDIRRAGPADAPALLNLTQDLHDHLSAAPIFRPAEQPATHERIARRLEDPAGCVFLACDQDEPIAYVDVQAANPSAAYIIEDPKTASITGMYTQKACRRRGIGKALLNQSVRWAQSMGYQRLAVDFEPQNAPGGRFWLQHFRPVCYSMIRHVDEQAAQATAAVGARTWAPWSCGK
jgi:GNAT superfamily N-acetyltransferase